jgi:hypothetical protein
VSLGLTGQNPFSPYLPPPVHKSAGLAFGLSTLIPGAGQFYCGKVGRGGLHDEKSAYAYWEKCASDAHAGCINNLAEARITGAGGQKVDVRQALDLLTAVYNSGTRYHCAGVLSALKHCRDQLLHGSAAPWRR